MALGCLMRLPAVKERARSQGFHGGEHQASLPAEVEPAAPEGKFRLDDFH
jgi:hypothetical protein